jgi:hypothetical protein
MWIIVVPVRAEAGELVFHRRTEIDVEVGERLVEQHERGSVTERLRWLSADSKPGRRSAKPSSSTSVSAAATRRAFGIRCRRR